MVRSVKLAATEIGRIGVTEFHHPALHIAAAKRRMPTVSTEQTGQMRRATWVDADSIMLRPHAISHRRL